MDLLWPGFWARINYHRRPCHCILVAILQRKLRALSSFAQFTYMFTRQLPITPVRALQRGGKMRLEVADGGLQHHERIYLPVVEHPKVSGGKQT